MRLPKKFFLYISLIIIAGLFILPVSAAEAKINTTGWTDPINISHSGGASDPLIVVDSLGGTHLLWKDTFAGYQYSRTTETGWTEPVKVTVPFGETNNFVVLKIDTADVVHATWLDNRDRLVYSKATAETMGTRIGWTGLISLATEVSSYSMVLDSQNTVHIAFIQSSDTDIRTAGVYYLSVKNALRTGPFQVTTSPYFREGDQETSQIEGAIITPVLDIVVGQSGQQQVTTILWSVPRTRQVSFSQSVNGSEWAAAIELETPEGMPGSAVPQAVLLGSNGTELLAMWQVSQEDGSCSGYFRYSLDGGTQWENRQILFPDIFGCLNNSKILQTDDQTLIMVTEINEVLHFSTWNDGTWNAPQSQSFISTFTDPETFNTVSLSCLQTVIRGETVYLSGCDRGLGGDIWLTTQQVAEILNSGDNTNSWSSLQVVDASSNNYFSPVLLRGEQQFYAFWSQPNNIVAPDLGAKIFFSTIHSTGIVSPPGNLPSPAERADQLAVIMGENDYFLAAWNAGIAGEVYFTQALSSTAHGPADWSMPIRVHQENKKAFQPQIMKGPFGRLYLAYAVPINEDRGVYLIYSDDLGQTWSNETPVFDAAADNCEMVDQLELGLTGSGTLQVSWVCQTQPGGVGALALWTTQSVDGGVIWSPPMNLSSRRVLWSELIATDGNTVHLLWKEYSSGRTHLWHSVKIGDEASWQLPREIASVEGESEAVDATIDPAQQIYLIHYVEQANRSTFNYWRWDGSEWNAGETSDLIGEPITNVKNLSAAISADGQMGLLFSAYPESQRSNLITPRLYFTSRVVDLPDEPILKIVTPKAPPAGGLNTPEPTIPTMLVTAPTATIEPVRDFEDPETTGSRWDGLMIGAVLVIPLIAIVILLQTRSRSRI